MASTPSILRAELLQRLIPELQEHLHFYISSSYFDSNSTYNVEPGAFEPAARCFLRQKMRKNSYKMRLIAVMIEITMAVITITAR